MAVKDTARHDRARHCAVSFTANGKKAKKKNWKMGREANGKRRSAARLGFGTVRDGKGRHESDFRTQKRP